MFRSLLILVAALTASSSFAATTVLSRYTLRGLSRSSGATLNARFAANIESPELGRAWIVFSGEESMSAGDDSANTILHARVRVTGLAYNAAAGTITLTLAGRAPLICARVSSSFFSGTQIDATDDCRLSTRMTTTRTDDRFEVRELPVAELLITIPDAVRR